MIKYPAFTKPKNDVVVQCNQVSLLTIHRLLIHVYALAPLLFINVAVFLLCRFVVARILSAQLHGIYIIQFNFLYCKQVRGKVSARRGGKVTARTR